MIKNHLKSLEHQIYQIGTGKHTVQRKNTELHIRIKKLSQHEKRGTIEVETAPFVLFVENFHQEQAAGGRGILRHGTIFRGEHIAKKRSL